MPLSKVYKININYIENGLFYKVPLIILENYYNDVVNDRYNSLISDNGVCDMELEVVQPLNQVITSKREFHYKMNTASDDINNNIIDNEDDDINKKQYEAVYNRITVVTKLLNVMDDYKESPILINSKSLYMMLLQEKIKLLESSLVLKSKLK